VGRVVVDCVAKDAALPQCKSGELLLDGMKLRPVSVGDGGDLGTKGAGAGPGIHDSERPDLKKKRARLVSDGVTLDETAFHVVSSSSSLAGWMLPGCSPLAWGGW
jgi:hypothetical protein